MLLRASELVVRHQPGSSPVLNRVSMSVDRGERVAIVGANGSGKSTLARALTGLIELESGRVHGARAGVEPRVGLVLQDPAAQLVAVTVADEIAAGPEGAGMHQREIARLVDESVRRYELDGQWHRDPATLSGGQQQRVAVASMDVCNVDVLVLDEPTAMLDPIARERLVATLCDTRDERALVWITQDPADLAWCDRIIVLDAGCIAWEGGLTEYLARPEVAATFELQQPPAARIAHALAARGVDGLDPSAARDLEALAQQLGVGSPGG